MAAFLQVLILGKSNAAVTGGAVGAITSGIAISLRKKKSESA